MTTAQPFAGLGRFVYGSSAFRRPSVSRHLRFVAAAMLGGWLLVSAAAPPACAQFTAITKSPLGQNGMGFGASWIDVDRDGDDDLYLTYDGPNVLLRNDGADKFVDVSAAPINDAGNSGSGVWGDSDNDGDLDLYLVNYLTANKLFRNDGPAGFTDVTAGPLGDVGAGQAAAWADFDRDGDVDLYLVNYGTPNKLFRNEGQGAFVDATTGPLADAGWGVAVAWGDYDNDGDPDLYITNDGPNRLLRNDGAGVFTRIPGLAIEDSGAGQGAAWGDFDNDGDLDLYLANWGTTSKLLRNDGGGAFTALTTGPLGDRVNGTGLAWGDFDNDGDLDIFRTAYGSGNKLLRNDGGGVFTAVTGGPLGDADNSDGTACADEDGDGDLDLYVVNDGHANALLRNDLTSAAHWIEIDLVGHVSNRSAIGARVRVVAGGIRRMREVSGGSGYLSQNSLTIHVGLGGNATADSITVVWPSGLVTHRLGVPTNQRITIDEPGPVGVDAEPGLPAAFRFLPPSPNPMRGESTFQFDLPRAAWVDLALYDVQGRKVATVLRGTRPAGRHTVRWSRAPRGSRMAAEVLLARLEAGRDQATRKIVLLP